MPSPEHIVLRARIEELSGRFVDFDIPPEREPTTHELDMIASFKLLAHAEFETFIETRIRDTLRRSLEKWKSDRQVTKALFGFLLRWYPWFEKDKNLFASPQPLQKITELLEASLRKATAEIDENNGIKREGFSRLCFSAGILVNDLSPILLAALESYGRSRGDVAHNAIGKVRTLNGPRIEANDAKQIVDLLDQFDELLIAASA